MMQVVRGGLSEEVALSWAQWKWRNWSRRMRGAIEPCLDACSRKAAGHFSGS